MEQAQQTKPWAMNMVERFFGKQEGEVVTPSQPKTTAPQEPWKNSQALWDRFSPTPTPKGNPIKDQVEGVFDKVIQAESRGQHRDKSGNLTTSPVGAQGITQVMPKTGKNPGYGVAPLRDDSEEEYVRFGKDLLRAYTRTMGGDIEKGLAAYNYGIGNVQRVVGEHGQEWKKQLPKETKDYLKKILGKQ